LRETEVRDRLAALGYEVIAQSPQQMAQLIRTETKKWAKVIQESGARPD
jgi:tripartite-type tricarboxylate transporter receptor subunit TctC